MTQVEIARLRSAARAAGHEVGSAMVSRKALTYGPLPREFRLSSRDRLWFWLILALLVLPNWASTTLVALVLVTDWWGSRSRRRAAEPHHELPTNVVRLRRRIYF
jgi:hypothetical protein